MTGAEHEITDGTACAGMIRETGQGWLAFDALDRKLGRFDTRLEAAHAVYEAHKGAASAASDKDAA